MGDIDLSSDLNPSGVQENVLKGRTFLVTRTKEGNAKEREILVKYGAKVIDFPTIMISSPSSLKKMDYAIANFEKYDWVIFTSSNGVKLFFQRMAKRREGLFQTLKVLNSPKFACVGPSTRGALSHLGFRCSAMPAEYLTENLGGLLARKGISGKKILLARAEVANKAISKILRKAGAVVTEAPVYRTVSSYRRRTLILKHVTDITLTSPSTVEGLVQILGSKLNSMKVRLHCIGPVTAARAREAGINVNTVARVHTIDGLISDIVQESLRSDVRRMKC